MSDNVWYLGPGDTGPALTGVLEREIAKDVWQAEDLSTVRSVTLTFYKANGSVYKQNAPVTIVNALEGRVSYAWVTADSQQGMLTGKCVVTYADGSQVSFPRPGRFQIRVG